VSKTEIAFESETSRSKNETRYPSFIRWGPNEGFYPDEGKKHIYGVSMTLGD
jgi:hypothetical protein